MLVGCRVASQTEGGGNILCEVLVRHSRGAAEGGPGCDAVVVGNNEIRVRGVRGPEDGESAVPSCRRGNTRQAKNSVGVE